MNVFEKKLVKRELGTKIEEVTREWRNLRNTSFIICILQKKNIGIIESRRMRSECGMLERDGKY
jgi:hypothetical protein